MMHDVLVTIDSDAGPVTRSFPFGTRAVSILKTMAPSCLDDTNGYYDDNPVVAVMVNNELSGLTAPVQFNCRIVPVRLFSMYGKRMYRHTICFMLAMAAGRVCPEFNLVIGHALGDGYYFSFRDKKTGSDQDISEELVHTLDKTIREFAGKAMPISKRILPYHEAVDWFRNAGRDNCVQLLDYQNRAAIELYECGNFRDISYEPLLPTTALVSQFQLRPYGASGMLLRYPRSGNPHKIGHFQDNPVLFDIFQEYKNWGSILSVDSLGKLNQLCERRQISSFIQVAESLQNKKVSLMADAIQEKHRKQGVRFVLIAGPSSSGKTTFAKKLTIQLRVLGFKPLAISLDDYYRDRIDVPLDDDGAPDLEALEALDTERLNADLMDLLETGRAEIPEFDFTMARRKKETHTVVLPQNGLIILEGIHGLNPNLTPKVPGKAKFRIYISALTQLNLDNHNRISTTDNRILRRMIRDHKFRGMSAEQTLNMWPSVHRGEKNNIFPYQNNADIAFNSALDYELAVLKPFTEPLLKTVKPSSPVYSEAVRLLTFIDNFYPIPAHKVPEDSLLREFIGGSVFYR